jgi:hypothetical protein
MTKRLEPVRGWAIFFQNGKFIANGSEDGFENETPVLVIPLTPESIADMREKVLRVAPTVDGPVVYDILTALDITQEETK